MDVGASKKKRIPEFRNLNLVPLLDFIVAVIPVLLLSVSFLEYVMLDTSLPAYAEGTSVKTENKDKKPKLGLSIVITDDGFVIAGRGGVLNIADGKTVIKKISNGSYNYIGLNEKLFQIKIKFPDEDSVIIIPESDTKFQDIISTMDSSREYTYFDKKGKITLESLFPNVLLGGGVL